MISEFQKSILLQKTKPGFYHLLEQVKQAAAQAPGINVDEITYVVMQLMLLRLKPSMLTSDDQAAPPLTEDDIVSGYKADLTRLGVMPLLDQMRLVITECHQALKPYDEDKQDPATAAQMVEFLANDLSKKISQLQPAYNQVLQAHESAKPPASEIQQQANAIKRQREGKMRQVAKNQQFLQTQQAELRELRRKIDVLRQIKVENRKLLNLNIAYHTTHYPSLYYASKCNQYRHDPMFRADLDYVQQQLDIYLPQFQAAEKATEAKGKEMTALYVSLHDEAVRQKFLENQATMKAGPGKQSLIAQYVNKSVEEMIRYMHFNKNTYEKICAMMREGVYDRTLLVELTWLESENFELFKLCDTCCHDPYAEMNRKEVLHIFKELLIALEERRYVIELTFFNSVIESFEQRYQTISAFVSNGPFCEVDLEAKFNALFSPVRGPNVSPTLMDRTDSSDSSDDPSPQQSRQHSPTRSSNSSMTSTSSGGGASGSSAASSSSSVDPKPAAFIQRLSNGRYQNVLVMAPQFAQVFERTHRLKFANQPHHEQHPVRVVIVDEQQKQWPNGAKQGPGQLFYDFVQAHDRSAGAVNTGSIWQRPIQVDYLSYEDFSKYSGKFTDGSKLRALTKDADIVYIFAANKRGLEVAQYASDNCMHNKFKKRLDDKEYVREIIMGEKLYFFKADTVSGGVLTESSSIQAMSAIKAKQIPAPIQLAGLPTPQALMTVFDAVGRQYAYDMETAKSDINLDGIDPKMFA